MPISNPPIHRPPFHHGFGAPTAHAFPMPDAKTQKKIRGSSFTILNLVKNCVLITALVSLHQLGTLGGTIFYIILGIWAAMGTENALKALSISFFALIANDFFVPKNMAFGPGRIILLFIVCVRVLYDAGRYNFPWSRHKYLLALYLFCGIATVITMINQYFVTISLLKILLFAVGATSYLLSAELLKRSASDMTCWFYSIIITTVALGLLAYAIGQGYNFRGPDRITYYFNGPFWQSQTLGPIAAMMITYLACVFLMTPYRLRWLSIGLAIVLLWFTYLTQSRTGLVTLVAGLGTLFMCLFFLQSRIGTRLRLTISKPLLLVLIIGGSLMTLTVDSFTGNRISTGLSSFILKTAETQITLEDIQFQEVTRSREGLMDMMIYNIQRRPLTGIGFGTSTNPFFIQNASLFTAPTEKGFLPLAVVEENGFIGAVFFLPFLFAFYYKFLQERNIPALVMFTALLGVNMGEMVFFSFGGQGGFMWLMVAGGILLGERCMVRAKPLARGA